MPWFFTIGENGMIFRMELLVHSPNEVAFSAIRNTSGLRQRESSIGYTRESVSQQVASILLSEKEGKLLALYISSALQVSE